MSQQLALLAQDAPHYIYVTVLQGMKAAMNNPGGTACASGAKIIFFNNQGPQVALSTLTGNCDTSDAATNHYNVKLLTQERFFSVHTRIR
jgi:hypothetical protein